MLSQEISQRTELLYGREGVERLAHARILVMGVGGVGSWCAEALVRTGVGHLTIVDADDVDATNINRQLPATTLTLGQPKVEVLRRRFESIRPDADIKAIHAYYDESTAESFHIDTYDVVIDAIDSLASKALLIMQATATKGVTLVSSMGAARRTDPSMVKTSEFWKVRGCPLARALRDRFKKSGQMPRRKFKCVYSDEPIKGEPKGSAMAVTATFGMNLAAIAINTILNKQETNQ